jgi:choline dehydrogenase-like flavoprotein
MSDSLPYLVIGSGPAGAAAAKALTATGRRVVVLDTGLTLEPERGSRSPALPLKAPVGPATSSCSAPTLHSPTTARTSCGRERAWQRAHPMHSAA